NDDIRGVGRPAVALCIRPFRSGFWHGINLLTTSRVSAAAKAGPKRNSPDRANGIAVPFRPSLVVRTNRGRPRSGRGRGETGAASVRRLVGLLVLPCEC